MPYELSGSGPQMWEIALNLEHWDKISWKSRSLSGFSQRNLVNWSENEKSGVRKATNALPFLILPEQAAARRVERELWNAHLPLGPRCFVL